MQNWLDQFYPERPDLIEELQRLASLFQGRLEMPRLRWKYAWIEPIFGWKAAKSAQRVLPQLKASLLGRYDGAMYKLENREVVASKTANVRRVTQEN